jgi:hypothetical protein
MKKHITLLFLILGILISCKSKNKIVEQPVIKEAYYIPYYLKVNEADSLRLVGNYQQSHQILDSLFQKYEPLNLSMYNEYFTYLSSKVLLKKYNKIDIVLKNAIENYGLKVERCLQDSLLKIATEKAKFTTQDLNEFYNTYVKGLNLEYRYAIEAMIANDQRVRLAKPTNHDDWVKVDEDNAENIKLLIAKYGYPSIKKIGRHDFNGKSSHIGLLFLHANKEARESYILELMLEAVKKGECEPTNFATVYDKYLFSSGKYDGKVLYGELRNPKKPLEEAVINPKKIDSIRKSIGLESINYKYWMYKKITGENLDDL